VLQLGENVVRKGIDDASDKKVNLNVNKKLIFSFVCKEDEAPGKGILFNF